MTAQATGPAPAGPVARFSRRSPALAATALVVVAGMTFFFAWGPIVKPGCGCWTPPPDIWGAVRSVHEIFWGYYGGIYAAGTKLVTFPGYLLVLAPGVAVSAMLHLAEPYPYPIPHPAAWLVVGPYTMALGCSVLFATDSLCVGRGASRGRRFGLALAGGAVVWLVVALWGHPEDPVAVALALYGLIAASDGRWARAGWLFGAAIAVQPLAVLVLPLALGIAGWRRMPPLILRAGLPSAALLAVPLLANFTDTARAILEQPNYPNVDFPTPWLALAPRLAAGTVSAGPARMIGVAGAVGLGYLVLRWPETARTTERLVWLAAVAFGLRCVFESVMVPYYAWPAAALALCAAALVSAKRLTIAFGAAATLTAVTYVKMPPWPYWLAMTASLALLLSISYPPPAARPAVSGGKGSGAGAEEPYDLFSSSLT